MAKKKVKTTKKKTSAKNKAVLPKSSDSISVNLKRARNGYVVSSYNDRIGKDVTYVAKTREEAKEYMDKLLRRK